MNKKILILGASGNFGSKIAKHLAQENIAIIIAGRQLSALIHLQNEIYKINPALAIEIVTFDIYKELSQQLSHLKPFLVINTCGPFQLVDYSIALNCIQLGIHYIDLADGRNFVKNFHTTLDQLAKENHCLAVSGASTVPCLSSAVIEKYKSEFLSIDSLRYGISLAQKSDRGLATTQAILSYVGKPLNFIFGSAKKIYGWQDLYRQAYPALGKRWMANCDIPDLDLFPNYYGISHIQFSAGMESNILHLGLWILSWLVRLGLPIHLETHASTLLKVSRLFDRFGSENSGMHMILSGKDQKGNQKTIKWFIIAKHGYGIHIPTIPAIILVKKLISGKIKQLGAVPCINLITLEEYLTELNILKRFMFILIFETGVGVTLDEV